MLAPPMRSVSYTRLSFLTMAGSAPSATPQNDFARLEPRVKYVSEAAIRKQWKKLPASSHAPAREAIILAKEQSGSRKGETMADKATDDFVKDVANRYETVSSYS